MHAVERRRERAVRARSGCLLVGGNRHGLAGGEGVTVEIGAIAASIRFETAKAGVAS